MKKLKCWKKLGKNSYRKRDDNRFLQVGISLKDSKKYGVYTQLQGQKMRTIKNEIKKKSSALKFANKYMKQHDKC